MSVEARAIAVDFAGTLTTAERRRPTGRMVRRVLSDFDIRVDEKFADLFDISMWPYYVESLDDSLERLIRDTASAYGLRLTKPVMRTLTNAVWDVCGDHPVDAAGAAALKAQHEAGRVMLLASNTCRPGAHRRRTLADAGLGFMHVICSSDVGVAKPDLGFYQWIIEESGVRPEEILFVGDNVLNDVARPKKAGMQAAWVRKSTPSNDSPARLPDGTWLLSSLSQLAEILP